MQTSTAYRCILTLIATLFLIGCGGESPTAISGGEFDSQASANVTLAKTAPATETFSDHIGETILDGNLGNWQASPQSPRCLLGYNGGPILAIDSNTRTVSILNAQFSSDPVQLEDDTWFYLRLTHNIIDRQLRVRVADSWGATNQHNLGITTFILGSTNNISFDEFGPQPFIIGGGSGGGVAPTVEIGGILDCGDTQYIGTFWSELALGVDPSNLSGTILNFKFKIVQATQSVKIAHAQWFISLSNEFNG